MAGEVKYIITSTSKQVDSGGIWSNQDLDQSGTIDDLDTVEDNPLVMYISPATPSTHMVKAINFTLCGAEPTESQFLSLQNEQGPIARGWDTNDTNINATVLSHLQDLGIYKVLIADSTTPDVFGTGNNELEIRAWLNPNYQIGTDLNQCIYLDIDGDAVEIPIVVETTGIDIEVRVGSSSNCFILHSFQAEKASNSQLDPDGTNAIFTQYANPLTDVVYSFNGDNPFSTNDFSRTITVTPNGGGNNPLGDLSGLNFFIIPRQGFSLSRHYLDLTIGSGTVGISVIPIGGDYEQTFNSGNNPALRNVHMTSFGNDYRGSNPIDSFTGLLSTFSNGAYQRVNETRYFTPVVEFQNTNGDETQQFNQSTNATVATEPFNWISLMDSTMHTALPPYIFLAQAGMMTSNSATDYEYDPYFGEATGISQSTWINLVSESTPPYIPSEWGYDSIEDLFGSLGVGSPAILGTNYKPGNYVKLNMGRMFENYTPNSDQYTKIIITVNGAAKQMPQQMPTGSSGNTSNNQTIGFNIEITDK
tara:strand:+ start:1073 stop:2668 length:1596 start_codon:yes stop_codon:yes gene_type:complete